MHEDKGWRGVAEGAGRIFFAYIGFDSISTHAEEARRPQRDLAIGIIGALTICTILYVAVAAVLTGMVPYRQIDIDAPALRGLAKPGPDVRRRPDHAGHPRRHDQLASGRQPEPAADPAGDGPRWALAPGDLRGGPSPVQNTVEVDDPGRPGGRGGRRASPRLGFLADLVSIGTLFAFVVVSAAVWILRITNPDAPRPFRAPWVPFVSTMGILVNGGMMFSPGPRKLAAPVRLARAGARDLFRLQPAPFRRCASDRTRLHTMKPSCPELNNRIRALPEVVACETSETGPRWYEGLTPATGWCWRLPRPAGSSTSTRGNFSRSSRRRCSPSWPAAIRPRSSGRANLGLAAFLLGGAVGGLFFGVLGDRFGRVRIMAYTILVYSIFSALTAFATTTPQVLVLRFLVAVGAGGEWAIAAALVAETFPAHSRASASGIFHASSVLGTHARIADRHGLRRPRQMAVGVPGGFGPALLVLWIRLRHSRARALGRGSENQ